jgi:hypothetical protein
MNSLAMRSFGWNRGKVGDGKGHSNRISVRLLFEPRDLWVGAYWNRQRERCEWMVYVCLIPCLPIRIHFSRSYGGIFPEAVR